MGYLKKYESFSNENIDQNLSRGIIKTIGFIKNITNKMSGIYMPFEFNDAAIGYEVERKIIDDLLDSSVLDILRIHISKKEKEGNKYTKKFSSFLKTRSKIDIYKSLEYILSNLSIENIKPEDDDISENEKSRVEEIVNFVNFYKSIIEKIDDFDIYNQDFIRSIRQLGELIRHLQGDTTEAKIDENKIYENTSNFDIDFIISKIKQNYSVEEVDELLKHEILNWIDDDWADNFDSEHDCYEQNNNGEAEEIVIDQITDWYEKQYNQSFNDVQLEKLHKEIKNSFDILNN